MSSSSSSSFSRYSGLSPPNRRPLILPSAISPFSTSPSQLQEISTFDDATLSMGIKSPQGTMRGRSVKEYEELLSNLKKDNFNLKLRIYFLEERMGSNNIIDRDSIIKENIELKVEAKTLHTELDEKQDLLCQAVKAMELEEEEHKKILLKKDDEIDNLSTQIESMSTQMQTISSQVQMLKSKSTLGVEDSIALYTEAFGLQDESEQIQELKRKICDLELQLSEERDVSSRLETEVQEMQCTNQRCMNLEDELEQREEKIRLLVQDLEEKGHRSSSLNLRIRGLEEELTHRNNEIEYKIREVKQRDNCIQEQTLDVEELRRMLAEQQLINEKDQRQVEILKSTIMARNNSIAELDTRLEMTKGVIRKMEAKLETSRNEVKRYHDELETLRRRSKISNNDSVDSISARTKSAANVPPSSPVSSSPSVHLSSISSSQKMRTATAAAKQQQMHNKSSPRNSPHKTVASPLFENGNVNLSDENRISMQERIKRLESHNQDLEDQVRKLSDMDEENRNALKVAKSLISGQKRFEKEKTELEEILVQKEDAIVTLTQKLAAASVAREECGGAQSALPASAAAPFGDGANVTQVTDSPSNKSLQEKICELNLTAASPPKKDNERPSTSTTSAAEDKELTEKYKELITEMKQQIEVYVALLAEKDAQVHRLQVEILAAGDTLSDRDNKIQDLGDEIDTLKESIALAVSNVDVENCGVEEVLCAEHEEHSGTEKQDVGSEKPPENLAQKAAQEKDMRIERLESDLRKKNADLQSVVNKELWEKNREIERMQNRYTALLETRELELDALQKELSGKKLELHLIMDRVLELDFRKRIEVHATNVGRLEINDHNINAIIDSIKEDVQSLQRENQMVLCKLKQCTSNSSFLESGALEENGNFVRLQVEYKDLQEELEKSEKLRQETTDICSAMTCRLEELALFLDSLLKHKSVLGFLGHEQKTSLRHLIDQSLDLSKTLSLSITLNPDQSLLQLSNISNILNNSKLVDFSFADLCDDKGYDDEKSVLKLEPAGATLVYNNYLTNPKALLNASNNRDEVIFKLREQVESLKKEIELRDVELGNQNLIASSTEQTDTKCELQAISLQKKVSTAKINLNSTSTTLKYPAYDNSESESWSEPDRSVSQARIGLQDESFKGSIGSASSLNRSKNRYTISPDKSTESTEEDPDILSGSKILRRELQEKIALLEIALKEKDNKLLQAECTYYELDNEMKKQRNDANVQLEILRQSLSASESKLRKAVAEKSKAEETLTELESVVAQIKNYKAEMEITVKESEGKICDLVVENGDLKRCVNEAQIEKEQLKQSCAEELQSKLQEVDDKWTNILKKIEAEAEIRVKEIQDATNELKRTYERDWVRKSDVDKKLLEVEVIARELEGLKSVVRSAEKKMAAMADSEAHMKAELQENEKCHREKVNALRKELDAATLATSEAILERTRVANDKLKLEQELRKFDQKETELMKQLNEFEAEFSATTHTYKRHLGQLEQQKSQLELRASELEQTNAELLNRLLKAQAEAAAAAAASSAAVGDSSWQHSHLGVVGGSSLPSSPNICVPAAPLNRSAALGPACLYKRQCSDLSGYTSDEIPADEVGSAAWHHRNNQLGAADSTTMLEELHCPGRHVVNSSPDLGIESDQGRFSSLEANVNSNKASSRPLLQTLELTQSMTNLLEVTNRSLEVSRANNEDCSNNDHKVLEEENVDLKKRLLRTRRALEETVSQLALANQRKKLVERAVCKQIHKTSQVLRKAKANLDSGSETDHLKK